ncbi:MAG: hypothetical protein Kow0068_05160 [Marinilabiliales bacterium]
MKFNKTAIYIILIVIIITSCKNDESFNSDQQIARVNMEVLHKSDLDNIYHNKYNFGDSLEFCKQIIDDWINRQLLYQNAVRELGEDNKTIDSMVDEYRKSLYIYFYQDKYINENIDTNINQDDFNVYYKIFAKDFPLNFNAVKAIYVKVKRNLPENYKVWNWYKLNNPDDKKKLMEYCTNNNGCEFRDFSNQWINFDSLLVLIPQTIKDQETFLKYNNIITQSDSTFLYFVNILDYRLKNDTTPLVFIKDKLKKIIINKRKEQLVNKLSMDLYQNAMSRKDIEIYKYKHENN